MGLRAHLPPQTSLQIPSPVPSTTNDTLSWILNLSLHCEANGTFHYRIRVKANTISVINCKGSRWIFSERLGVFGLSSETHQLVLR
ncbi:uncharacterized protein PHALS_08263 [Plasmopara halstedii]|uniref:Uncharacterized protein n=1 Tax=Plasmopara halstedii TaxID=4781 RepID=A0A0P1ACK1_PLAHL|nr:uncharacterized protein PHALS_08263 [Plasmopara halstedii]CEG38175.1 hypothetical protein PHALS_08263 [Plasmopara halstedii]|eukprot:XP_024574544.1 hypothetical protein PHALS_08263 [Plasmopara halstedii]